jgi:small subunit ribosomal protein S8
MMTDTISDMLTRIRNASITRAAVADMPMSNMKFAMAKILEKEGYLAGVETFQDGSKPMLRVRLAYRDGGEPVLSSITRKSKPSLRVYVKAGDLKMVRSGFGFSIVSTPNGLMTNKEAHKRRLGGELICEIY